jgi:hypothetical protein
MYLIERCTVYEVRDGKPEMYVFWRRDGIAARGKSQMEVMHDDLCAKDVAAGAGGRKAPSEFESREGGSIAHR